jgi:membrane fusion protein (multidrug efflux system)
MTLSSKGTPPKVSPKVSGYVQRIYITDNQQVKAGDLLVEIDPRDYEVRLAPGSRSPQRCNRPQ